MRQAKPGLGGSRKERWPIIQERWLLGETTTSIATLLNMSAAQVGTEMVYMRRAGWDLPRRRISDQGAANCADAGRLSKRT